VRAYIRSLTLEPFSFSRLGVLKCHRTIQYHQQVDFNGFFPRWAWISRFSVGSCPPPVQEKNIEEQVAQIVTSQTPFLSPNRHCQGTDETISTDHQVGTITRWPHPFIILHRTPYKESSTANFTPDLWCQYPTTELYEDQTRATRCITVNMLLTNKVDAQCDKLAS